MIDKILNNLNLAVILLVMTVSIETQAQQQEEIVWLACGFEITELKNSYPKSIKKVIAEPFPMLKTKVPSHIKLGYTNQINLGYILDGDIGVTNTISGFEISRASINGNWVWCYVFKTKAEAQSKFDSGLKNSDIILTYQPPKTFTGIEVTIKTSTRNNNETKETQSSRGGTGIKEGSYNTETKKAVERATLAMKQQKAEEKVKSMATAIQGAKYQAELDRSLKLLAEKMRLNGRRQ